jgi:tetratricopeptide (TPR) repeat protein
MKMIDEAAIGRALDYFDTVAKRDGALKWYARQQQAIIQSARRREAEAVALYDIILKAEPPADAELRYSAAIGKGDNLLALGEVDPSKTQSALEIFQEVAQTEGIPSNWRNQALYKKARVLEQLDRTNEAITAYWEVLDANARAADREFFWYYKAGFDAARIFEQRGAWREAIGIYEKMIVLDGPRTEEARARTKAIRLEHHIW